MRSCCSVVSLSFLFVFLNEFEVGLSWTSFIPSRQQGKQQPLFALFSVSNNNNVFQSLDNKEGGNDINANRDYLPVRQLTKPLESNNSTEVSLQTEAKDISPIASRQKAPIHPAWRDRYQELARFVDEHGHALVPYDTGNTLANWVRTQRRKYREGNLSLEKVRLLEMLGFTWSADEKRWMSRYEELIEFQQQYGHTRVRTNDSKHTALAAWVQRQRTAQKKQCLDEERFRLLERIGFCWDVFDWNFARNLELVRNETTQEGKKLWDYKVPDGPLGLWVSHQKREYRKYRFNRTHSLTEQQIEALEGVGFSFQMIDTNYTRDATRNDWEKRMKELWEFKEKHGHTNVPRTQQGLGSWVKKVRERMDPFILQRPQAEQEIWKRSNPLWERDLERLEELQEVGFIWDVYEWRWQNNFRNLLAYQLEHGHTNVPSGYASLGTWVRDQRAEFAKIRQGKASRMTVQRARALSRIGFEFARKETVQKKQAQTFEQRLGEYRAAQEQSDTKKPKMDKSLRYWVENQRRHYRKWMAGKKVPSTFTKERRAMLESSGMFRDLMAQDGERTDDEQI